ncbi:Carboxypeptidase Y [Candida parapsilosis]|nr:Carboxypeptidase Y [Candida parapsilosis]KAI5911241.1 Carboxypeptidase Y [Candida parapsilosis]
MKFSVVANGALVTSTIYAIPFEWQIPFSYFGLEAPQSPPPSTSGPGCASFLGLLLELGPASISKDIKPVHNPHSWNNNATNIFLDSPVNVGYSYSSNAVTSADAAAKDILFFKQFHEYAKLNFHLSGESYGGHYLPTIANKILNHLERSFNLTLVMVGNGYADVKTQYQYFNLWQVVKEKSQVFWDPDICEAMKAAMP